MQELSEPLGTSHFMGVCRRACTGGTERRRYTVNPSRLTFALNRSQSLAALESVMDMRIIFDISGSASP